MFYPIIIVIVFPETFTGKFILNCPLYSLDDNCKAKKKSFWDTLQPANALFLCPVMLTAP